MKHLIVILTLVTFLFGCKATKQINKVIAPKDTLTVVDNRSEHDSIEHVKATVNAFQDNYIDFRTFSAKVKVDVESNKGKQPDITAVIRMVKDSAIWISLTATILNIEIYRVMIRPDSVVLLNKQDKEVQFRSLDYLQEVADLPVNFKTLQDLLIGNPVFYNDTITSFREVNGMVLMSTIGPVFKNLLTLTASEKLLQHIKMFDVYLSRNRTADITYDGYEKPEAVYFPTNRQITISEKNKLDIRMKFKQYEFNKELSLPFNIPKNYKSK